MSLVELEGAISGIGMANRERGRNTFVEIYGNNGSVTPFLRISDLSVTIRNIGGTTEEDAAKNIPRMIKKTDFTDVTNDIRQLGIRP